MGGQRIADAKNAYIELTNQLKDIGIADVASFAVIPFNSGSTLYADLTADEAIARISSLGAGGGTSFGPALSNAQTFFSSANPGQTNIAYFLSDGQGSGASDSLTSIANVQAFGIGSGANLSSLNIIDSDDAILLSSSSHLVDVLTGSGASVDEIDGIAISVDGNVVDFITPDQLVDGPLGFQYRGTISGLDVNPDAQNEITATVFLKGVEGAKGSTTLSIASAFGDTSVTRNTDDSRVVLSAFDTSYNADIDSAATVILLANDLDNEIIATNTGGTFSTFGGNDFFSLGDYANSTVDRVIDGGSGYDIIEYVRNYIQSLVSKVGNVIKIGSNTDTISSVEEIRFSDFVLDTETFTLTPRNSPPVAVDDAFGVDEDQTLSGNVLDDNGNGADSDADGDPLTAALVIGPAHGALVLNADGTFTYTPNADFNGADSFTYRATDGAADSNLATVALTVTPVNDAPVAVNDRIETAESTPVAIDVLANDSDPDTDLIALSLAGSTQPANGRVLLGQGKLLIYLPDAGTTGPDQFDYQIADEDGKSATATVTVDVTLAAFPVIGTAGRDLLSGTDAGNLINGGAGVDRIAGLGGNDVILGGEGADLIDGGSGADIIDGGLGRDTIFGGPGADTFVLSNSDTYDFIRDFEVGVDKILLAIDAVLTDNRAVDASKVRGVDTYGDDLLLQADVGAGFQTIATLNDAAGSDLISILTNEIDDGMLLV